MRTKKLLFLALGAMWLMFTPASADESVIAYVKVVSGEASIHQGDIRKAASVGAPIHIGDVLKTGLDGNMGITMKDNTVMSFGPDTEFVVDEYLYQPARGQLKLGGTISRGTLNYVSGVIAKLRPEAVTVRTPTGTIGVRGTRFLVKVER